MQPDEVSYEQYILTKGFTPQSSAVWSMIGKPNKSYFWKIHVSAVQQHAISLLDSILPFLKECGFPFKIAKNSTMLGLLNEGAFGETQIGKFMTIYPNDGDGRILAESLSSITDISYGPQIITDLYIGGCVYVRYGSHAPSYRRNRLGMILPVEEDMGYTVPFVLPKGISNSYSDFSPSINSTGSGSRLLGNRYFILNIIASRPQGSTLLAVDMDSEIPRMYVIKEGKRGALSDNYGRDIWDRLRYQHDIHKALYGRLNIPDVQECFEQNGKLYLPIEYIENSQPLSSKIGLPYMASDKNIQREILKYLFHLSQELQALHSMNIVHRDISPRNILINHEVALIDFEMSATLNCKSIPFEQGTPGYVSPQQYEGYDPKPTDDIYSFGAVALHLLCGFDPRRIDTKDNVNLATSIHSLSGVDFALCEIIAQCLDHDPAKRPSLREIEKKFVSFTSDNLLSDIYLSKQNISNKSDFTNNETVLKALRWIIDDRVETPSGKVWLSAKLEAKEHTNNLNYPHEFTIYRSASRGVSGVLYLIAKASRFGYSLENSREVVDESITWLLKHHSTDDDQLPGLHFGEAGVAVAIAEAIASGLVLRESWNDEYFHEVFAVPPDWPDLTHGAAGQGLAALICAELTGTVSLEQRAALYVQYLLDSQNSDGSWQWPEGVSGMQGAKYTGFAHGIAGITYFLLKYLTKINSADVADAARRGLKWLVDNGQTDVNGTMKWSMQSDTQEMWHWWCHGGPGIALAFLEGYTVLGDAAYAATARSALQIHPTHVRYSNLSQCHGLSGLGEIYLEAYRHLRDEQFLHKAQQIGAILESLVDHSKNKVSWLVENPFLPTSDLMVGCGGVAHFLIHLEHADLPGFSFPLSLT